MSTCPCCGGQMAPTEARVDLPTNTLITPLGKARLTRQEADMLAALLAASPRVVSYDTLCSQLWGVTEPNTAKGVLKQVKKRLVPKAGPLGVSIENSPMRGYRAIFRERAAHAA